MSRIDDLVAELCPEGVPHACLADFASESSLRNVAYAVKEVRSVTSAGIMQPTSETFENSRTSADTGNYKVVEPGMFAYNPSRVNIGSLARNSEEQAVIVSPMYVVFRINEEVIRPRYLQAISRSTVFVTFIRQFTELGARFRMPFSTLSKLNIPLPPVPLQEEIVRVLETFTELEAELEAELEVRTTQYEEARNRLMNFDALEDHPLSGLIRELCPAGVEMKLVSEVARIERGQRVTKSNLVDDGSIPVVSGGTGYMGFMNQSNRDAGTITMAQYGTAGYVKWQTQPFWANDVCFSFFLTGHSHSYRFFYHFLKARQGYLYSISNRDAVPFSIRAENVLSMKIPAPPLPVQEEIVRILDSFDSLVTDLSVGLPAEIAARRKQYEYYRDKLLSFEDLAA